MNKIQIIGAPIDLGSELLGVDIGPNAIRHAGLIPALKAFGYNVLDNGNININPPLRKTKNQKLKFLREILNTNSKLANLVYQGLKKDYLPITLGGDHTIALGSVSAIKKYYQDIALIWIDAHPDTNTDKTTLTGNIHGMPLAALLGEGHQKLTNFLNIYPKLNPKNVAIIGAKDIDDGEMKVIRRYKLLMFTIDDIEEQGIHQIVQKTLKKILKKVKHLHISMDLDAIDIKDAPGVGMQNYGGLTYREISYLARKIGAINISKSIDVVELNPTRDLENKTAKLAVELILSFLGKRYTNYELYLERNRF